MLGLWATSLSICGLRPSLFVGYVPLYLWATSLSICGLRPSLFVPPYVHLPTITNPSTTPKRTLHPIPPLRACIYLTRVGSGCAHGSGRTFRPSRHPTAICEVRVRVSVRRLGRVVTPPPYARLGLGLELGVWAESSPHRHMRGVARSCSVL